MKKVLGMFFEGIGNAILAVLVSGAALCGVVSGLVCKARGKKWQTFSREVDGIGEFHAQGTSEKDCGCWTHTFDYGPLKNVELALSGKMMKDQTALAIVGEQFKAAVGNADKVVAAVREDWLYKKKLEEEKADTLVPQKEVYAELYTESEDMSPYMAIFYTTGKYQVWISVQDGEMTGFDLSEDL